MTYRGPTGVLEGKVRDGGGRYIDVRHSKYNADDTGSLDSHNAIQKAMDDLFTAGGGDLFLGPRSTYKLGSLFQWHQGVNVIGGQSSHSNGSDNARLFWGGAGGGTMVNQGNPDNNGQNLQSTSMRGVTLYGANSGTANASRAAHAITFSKNADGTTNKVDFGSRLVEVHFERFGSNAAEFNGGMTNVHIVGCRGDHISGYLFYFADKYGSWTGSIRECTWDTGSEAETDPKGFLFLDGQSQTDGTTYNNFAIEHAKLEINKALTGNAAVIALGVDSVNNTQVVQHFLKGMNVHFAFADTTIAGTNDVVGIIGGPSDGVDIEMIGCPTAFPDSVRHFVNGLTSTWMAPNPSSSNKYHPTHWSCRPFGYGAPGGSQSRRIMGEKVEIRGSLVVGGDGSQDFNLRNTRGAICLPPVSATPNAPPANCLTLFNAAGVLKQIDSTSTVKTVTVS